MFVLKDFIRALGRTAIMGIVNATGDSFSEGRNSAAETAVSRGCALAECGADILDIGGESTRPGAEKITVQTEIDRVIPVLCELRKKLPQMIFSVDTVNAETAEAALQNGAAIINDVSMLRNSDKLAQIVAARGGALILNHSRAASDVMQQPQYCSYPEGTAKMTAQELDNARQTAIVAGVKADNIMLDPGIGFSKTASQCWELLRDIEQIGELPKLVIGVSRKSFLAEATGETVPASRLGETLAIELEFASRNIGMIRTHAVRELHNALTALRYFRRLKK